MEQNRFALVSQQFRLRDIIQIVCLKIGDARDRDEKGRLYYYTLHKCTSSPPLFISTKCPGICPRFPPLIDVDSPRTKTVTWPELKKDFEQDSPRQSVIIRLWRTESGTEKMIICYGIHFNGLVPFSKLLLPSLKPNSLVIHTRSGSSFVSPDSIDWDSSSSSSNNSFEEAKEKEANSPRDNNDLFLKYSSIQVPTSNLKSCCTLEQLLRLQQGQLRLKYKRELLRSLIMEIQSKSAICMTEEMLQRNPSSFVQHHFQHRAHNHHHNTHHHAVGSMGKTLTRLLNMEPEPVDAKTLIAAHKLRKQMESVRVRCRLLAMERDRAGQHVEGLERRRATNCDRIVEMDSSIMANYHAMNKEKEQYLHLKLTLTKDMETMTSSRSDWRTRKQTLLQEICEIYDVRMHEGGHYTINGISLPDAEEYEKTHVPAMSISVALGYVAHLVLVISNVLAVPLRNSIIFKGSQSQIMGQLQRLNTNVWVYDILANIWTTT